MQPVYMSSILKCKIRKYTLLAEDQNTNCTSNDIVVLLLLFLKLL